MSALSAKQCVPCRGDVPPLKGSELEPFKSELPDWQIVDEHHLSRTFRFPDFVQALAFVNRVGELAEAQGHHPDLYLAWGQVRIDIWTHKINGLTESDFVLAAKCEDLVTPDA